MSVATIVNPAQEVPLASSVAPIRYGYLLLAASIAPPKGPPFVRRDVQRDSVADQLREPLGLVERQAGVVRATGFRAVLIPPGRAPSFRPALTVPRYDLVVLIETESPDQVGRIAGSPAVDAVRELLQGYATMTCELDARCVKAIADVEKVPTGTYLFNFWAAADRDRALDVWGHLAGWFQSKTGLRNSTVLQPEVGDFALVNHARWDTGIAAIAAHQFLRPSFYTFVRRNLRANQIHVYPALYRRI